MAINYKKQALKKEREQKKEQAKSEAALTYKTITKEMIVAKVEELRSTYPVFAEYKPLAIGIHEKIPNTSLLVKVAIGHHTRSKIYLGRFAAYTYRHNLKGEEILCEHQKITKQHKQNAKDLLNKIYNNS